ncbi:hypothetical protein VRRI112168_20600 [Vreelandella rituensis]
MRNEPAILMAAASPRLLPATTMVTTILITTMLLMANSEAMIRATNERWSNFIESTIPAQT